MTSIPTSILRLWSSTDSTNDGRGWTEHIQIPSKFNILLMMASQPEANQSPVELVNFCPSPPARMSRRSARNSATPQHRLPCPLGHAPAKLQVREVVRTIPILNFLNGVRSAMECFRWCKMIQ